MIETRGALFLSLAFAAEVLGTLTGFGSSTFFVPMGSLIEGIHFVLVITAILHCFGNFARLIMFRRSLNWRLIVPLAAPAIVLTGVGALLTSWVSARWTLAALGPALILISLIYPFAKRVFASRSKSAAYWLSGLSGFLTGWVGTGGAIRGVALILLGLEKEVFVATSAGIDVGSDLLRAAIYIHSGFMDWKRWALIPLLALAAGLGVFFGRLFLRHINQVQFERLVAVTIFLSGLVLIIW